MCFSSTCFPYQNITKNILFLGVYTMSIFKKFGKKEENVNNLENENEETEADFEGKKDETIANIEEKKQQVDDAIEKAEKAKKVAGVAARIGKFGKAASGSAKIHNSTSTLRNADKK